MVSNSSHTFFPAQGSFTIKLDASTRLVLLLSGELLLRVLDRVSRRGDLGGLNIAAKHVVAPEIKELLDAIAVQAAHRHIEDGVQLLERLALLCAREVSVQPKKGKQIG